MIFSIKYNTEHYLEISRGNQKHFLTTMIPIDAGDFICFQKSSDTQDMMLGYITSTQLLGNNTCINSIHILGRKTNSSSVYEMREFIPKSLRDFNIITLSYMMNEQYNQGNSVNLELFALNLYATQAMGGISFLKCQYSIHKIIMEEKNELQDKPELAKLIADKSNIKPKLHIEQKELIYTEIL